MNRTVEVKCERCGFVNKFREDDLVSGMSIKDDDNKIIQLHPEVTIDENTFIKCDSCNGPTSCANFKLSNG